MEKIAFMGSYDKADLILYIAKILDFTGKKIIVIDSTSLQKTRYIVPKVKPAKRYITTFEKVDVAVGFENFAQIKEYCDLKDGTEFNYDYALVNIDSYKGYSNFEIKPDDRHFFITSLDLYSLRRGLQIFKKMQNKVSVQKILFSKNMLIEEDQYINFLSKDLNVEWKGETIFFPFDQGDQTALYANQRAERIQTAGLSKQYMEGLSYLMEIMNVAKPGVLKKAMNLLERN